MDRPVTKVGRHITDRWGREMTDRWTDNGQTNDRDGWTHHRQIDTYMDGQMTEMGGHIIG